MGLYLAKKDYGYLGLRWVAVADSWGELCHRLQAIRGENRPLREVGFRRTDYAFVRLTDCEAEGFLRYGATVLSLEDLQALVDAKQTAWTYHHHYCHLWTLPTSPTT